MTRDHDRFESLAGALALGEATAQERERFAAHARRCAACRTDADGFVGVRERIETARASETWRPSLGAEVVTRIRTRRLRRARSTFRALAWSIALSLLADAAVVSGLGTYASHALHDASLTGVVAALRAQTR